MKKSIYLFIGGSLFGVIVAVAVFKTSTNTNQTIAITPPNTTGMKVVTAKMQVANMPTESMSDMQVRLSQLPENKGMMDSNAMMSENPETVKPIPQQNTAPQENISSGPITQPTDKQIQQYDQMEKIIASAVNNPKIKLTDLLRQSDTLTIQQRTKLTQKAMDMINRGELNIEQFASN